MRRLLGADSAGTPLLTKIIHCSQLASAQVQSVTFILSVFAGGQMSKNKLKIAIASNPTIGNPLSAKFARRPIPWFCEQRITRLKQGIAHIIQWTILAQLEIILCLKVSIKRRIPQESSILLTQTSLRPRSNLVVATNLTYASMISLYPDAMLSLSSRRTSRTPILSGSILKTTSLNLALLY